MTPAYKHLLYQVRITTYSNPTPQSRYVHHSETMVLDGSEVDRNFTWGKAIIGLDSQANPTSARIDHGYNVFRIEPVLDENNRIMHQRPKHGRRCEDCQ